MDDHAVAEVTDWSAEPFSGGYDGLHRLADRSFTGAVESGGAFLFFLNGAAVGVVDGTMEGFEGASGTAYEAPHPSLPLLFAMQHRDGETRGRYYTEDTPVTEVDTTLAEGGFTGYLELAENVLSGDYYAVYQRGKSMRVAFVGQSRRVLTDGEAWEKTRDEVGIYEVERVPLEVLDIPGEAPESASGTGAGPPSGAGVGSGGSDAGDASTVGEGDPAAETSEADAGSEPADTPDDAPPADREEGPADDDVGVRPGDPIDIEAAGPRDDEGDEDPTDEEESTGAPAVDDEGRADATAVPSVDPDRTADAEGADPSESLERPPGHDEETVDLVDEVEAELAERDEELAEAKRRIAELRDRRDDLKRQLGRVREERDEFRAELDRLGGAGATPERQMSPAEVLAGTTLFVRYDSKAKTTLEDVMAGEGEESTLRSNLRIEHHTEFDAEGVVVDGEPVAEYVDGTQAARFLRWVVTGLFLELRATDGANRMGELYEAIPTIDRAQLDRTVTVTDAEAGGEREVAFDLVARDQMGQPRLVADLSEGRDPVGQDQLAQLVRAASDVCRTDDSLAGAFGVARSYFDSDALATAREATSGSLLSRDRRRSFVKLSRKSGYHLCLVEARDESFYLSVPDL